MHNHNHDFLSSSASLFTVSSVPSERGAMYKRFSANLLGEDYSKNVTIMHQTEFGNVRVNGMALCTHSGRKCNNAKQQLHALTHTQAHTDTNTGRK